MSEIDLLLAKALRKDLLDENEALKLLQIKNCSEDYYNLISAANELTRQEFNNKGYIFTQLGINAEPCSVNCKFCSMGKDHYVMESKWRKDLTIILKDIEALVKAGIDDLFIMTTADFPIEQVLLIGKHAKKLLPPAMPLVVNIGDFDYETALQLKKVGFTGAYHINRLREGIDTDTTSEMRIKTLDAIKKAGLDLYYCVEPIGPEHSYEELVTEMIRARNYQVQVMAVMRRIPVKGVPLYHKGQITAVELTKIAAVARLVSQPTRAMNAHETVEMSLIAGVNQLYAELGANPRDDYSKTENNRGFSVAKVRKLLQDAQYEV